MILTEHPSKAPHSKGLFGVLCNVLRSKGSGVSEVLLLMLGMLVLTSVPALANSGYAVTKSIGEKGSAAGEVELASNSGVAINDATSDVYVADTGNHRVDVFNDEGVFQFAFGKEVGPLGEATCTTLSTCKAGASGSELGEFETPTSVAVDNASGGEGGVYVADTGTGVVQKFTAEGALVSSWGIEGQLGTTPTIVAKGMGDLENGSTTITERTATSGSFRQNQKVSGEGISPGTYLEAGPPNGTGLRLTKPATKTGEHVELTASRSFNERVFRGIAVDRVGDLWVENGGVAFDFARNGSFVEESAEDGFAFEKGPVYEGLPGVSSLPREVPGSATGLALDQMTNALYVDRGSVIEDFGSTGGAIGTFSSAQLEKGGGAGLAIEPASDTVYAANASANQVEAFNVTLEVNKRPATETTATTATLNGEVNSKGGKVVECYFELGTSIEYGEITACEHPDAAEIGAGSSAVPVHSRITGLRGGTTYHFRLIAIRENLVTHEKTSVSGEDEVFAASPIPVVAGEEAVDVTATSAELRATVNPEGLQVSHCSFEYGTGTSYGQVVRCAQKKSTIGAGTEPVLVSAQLTELAPDTTYHWRLAVRDANGETFSPDHAFVYPTSGAELPDGRAYEMASPVQKNGSLIGDVFYGKPPVVSDDGSRVIALDIQCFAPATSCDANRGENGEPVELTRTAAEAGRPAEWKTTALAPPAVQFSENTPWLLSANEGTALFSMPTGPAQEDEWYARSSAGSFAVIGPATPPGVIGVGDFSFSETRATADLSHLVWENEDSYWAFDGTQHSGGQGSYSAYEYVGAGNREPFLVGVAGGTGKQEQISTCGTSLGGGKGNNWNDLSADGRTVYFTSEPLRSCPAGVKIPSGTPPVEELYARVDGGLPDAHTVTISQPDAPQTVAENAPDENCTSQECKEDITKEENWRDALFAGASEDGTSVFFLDTQKLTDGAIQSSDANRTSAVSNFCSVSGNACNLYLYDMSQPAGHNLIDASEPETSNESPRVQGVVATSADGSHVYFVAQGVLTAAPNTQGQSARSGRDNLYVYERDSSYPAGHTAFVASLPGSTQAERENWLERKANVTPDGRFLVFESSGDLTSDDTRGAGGVGGAQIFRYDATSGELVRVSVGESGFDDDGNAGVGEATIAPAANGHAGPARGDPTMSDDGSYVFFQSPVGLTPHALDDVVIGHAESYTEYAQNVYEYHAGHVYLISDGHDTSNASTPCGIRVTGSAVCLLGADTTGANVFFMTADRLVPADTDTQVDIYDARICEPAAGDPCVASEPPPLSPCLGEACHGIPAATPSLLAPGSATFDGAGDLVPAPPAVKAKAKALTKAQKLADALKRCKKVRSRSKRAVCEKQARQKYGAPRQKQARKSTKRSSNDRRAVR
jgi:hypothetical protein